MPVVVQWLDEAHTILIQNLNGRWTLKDFERVITLTAELLNVEKHPVDIVTDFTGSAGIPPQFPTLARLAEANISQYQRLAVIVNAGTFLKSIVEFSKNIAPKATAHIQFADSREQALQIIARYREDVAHKT